MTFDDNGITLTAELPFHAQNINGRNLPKIDVSNFDINFDSSKIHIDFEGSLLADIIAIFIRAFKTTILNQIRKLIDQEVPDLVQHAINEKIIESNGFATLVDNITIDFQIPREPFFVNDTFELYINGTIFDNTTGYKVPSTPLTNIDVNITKVGQMVVDAS